MELIQELEVWYIIPAIRKEIALAMRERGLRQVEIAKILGITKSAINQYIKDKRGSEFLLNKKMKEIILETSTQIKNQQDTLKLIQHLMRISREEKLACQIHKTLNKDFAECGLCFEPLISIGGRKQ